MSTIPEPPPRPSPPAQRSGCLTAFMILAGLILLLPGLCAVIFGVGEFTSSSTDPVVMTLVTVGLILGAVGIGMIWTAIRGRAR
jgi:hypothetical protein